MIRKRKALDKLVTYQPGKSIAAVKTKSTRHQILKLASNENPLGCPIKANDLTKVCQQAHHYPDQSTHGLIPQLARFWGLDKTQVVLGNGSDDLMQLLALAYLEPGCEVITSRHTFSMYAHNTHVMGATYREVPMKEWYYDLDGILAQIKPETKMIFIANPNNPTGTYLDPSTIQAFLAKVRPDILVILDEAYGEFVTQERQSQPAPLLSEFPNVVILRTFSKAYGLAGFRVGYGLASPEVAAHLEQVRQPFNVNVFSLTAASMALKMSDFLERSVALVQGQRPAIIEKIRSRGLTCLDSEANFICLFLDRPADELDAYLLSQGLIIRHLKSFGLDHGIRVTISTPEDMAIFDHHLDVFLSQS